MQDLNEPAQWLAMAAVALAALVHGTFGLGFPLVATPLLALGTDVRGAVLLTLLPTITINLSLLLRGSLAGAQFGHHWRMLPFVLLGAACGSALLLVLDPRPFLLLLAAALLLYLNQERLGERLELSWVHRRTKLAHALFGTAAGLMAGTVNVMVPVLIILAMELRLSTPGMVQLFNLNFLAAKSIQLAIFSFSSAMTAQVIKSSLLLLPAALLALLLGIRLRRHISEENYRGVLRGVLWSMAFILVGRFLLGG
uniref:Probable membrane transporter protein n=1 Tax=Candidatus Kentrum sp. TUN TaxID=2126343 RepID=A0A450ZHY2_9GAMM|nr:MAG: hypothetical protein BECKTUN1418F_GA0071002_101915 [Candidatus Kentron sp. TUN]VFK55208.1 MAG: hypothetical protein BECKTUN1418E_GA0071001_10268 [Candidatus Kentron sp. TUN]